MSLKDWFKGGTPLQLAIERGLKPGGDLVAELDHLDDYTIKSKRDAQAICRALETVNQSPTLMGKREKSPLYKLAGLFQDTEGGSAACEHLRGQGIPLLVQLARKARAETAFDQGDYLFVLKMLAAYGTKEGADLVIEAAQSGYASEGYLWSVVLGMFSAEHPEARRVFTALSDPLPDKFLAVSLLDAANRLWLDGGEMRHPFDSDRGIEQLERWLGDSDAKHFSYAISATAALPFIQHVRREDLFNIAYNHPDISVQMEAAWAAAKLEQPGGLQKLAALCKQVNYSTRAKSYLQELGREDLIPAESAAPDFEAKAEFANWLAHPNELARYPDELEIIDQRDLRWPTDGEVKHFWLIKFLARDQTGLEPDQVDVGFVGNGTWCHFSYELNQRPPEDAYAIHCYWHLAGENLITDSNVEGSSDYDSLLQEWTGAHLEQPKLLFVSELSPQLNYPRRLIGLAAAHCNEQAGWAVLDGPESRWYSAEELPDDEYPRAVLMLHIGRRLLGFQAEPDRKRFLQQKPVLPPAQIERVFERLLADAETGSAERRKELLGSGGLLANHLEAYVDAKNSLYGGGRTRHFVAAYERVLSAARHHPDECSKLLDSFAALGQGFDEYVVALVATGRQAEVVPLMELFTPYFQHNLGYGLLATAAFKAGRDDLAETFCLRLKDGLEDWYRSEEMSYLAEIWQRQGKITEARSLLVECLSKLLLGSGTAEGSDRKRFEEWFQNHRKTFLRLFPGESLEPYGIPDSTFR